MNPTLETILTRRSIRAFKPDMLPRETIDAIIEENKAKSIAKRLIASEEYLENKMRAHL